MKASARIGILKRTLLAAAGLFFYGFCVYCFLQADLGAAPWDVFCLGLSGTLQVKYGTASILISVLLIVIDLLMGEKIGLGTLLDAFIVGKTVDLFNALDLIPRAEGKPFLGAALLLFAFVGEAFAQFLYMKAALGCGPRDSFQLALGKRLTKLSIGMVNVLILVSVLAVGLCLKGPFGIGTLLAPICIGFFQDIVFRLTAFRPKEVKHLGLAAAAACLLGKSREA